MSAKDKKILFILEFLSALLCIAVVNIIAAIYNNGLEGDEVFSYISATSTGGFKKICYLEDQTWYDTDYFQNAVTADGEERFNIKMVFENQKMDTHPPLYYLFLNLICSVFKGQYSRWFGIGLNLFLMLIMGIGLYLLICYFIQNRHIALLTSTIFCCSRLAVSMTLFIRMYVLSMVLVVFTSLFHLKLYDRMMTDTEYPFKKHLKEHSLLFALTLAGALTHYYFLVYQCLISALFAAALLYRKKYQCFRCYLVVMAGCAITYIALYPTAIYHILFKYRGRDAVHKFLKESSLFKEAYIMFSSFDDYLFKGCLLIILLLLLTVTAIFLYKRKIKSQPLARLALLSLPSLIYFYGVAKASPYTIVRYISLIAALLYAALIIWAKYLADTVRNRKIRYFSYIAMCACLFASTFYFFDQPIKEPYFSKRRSIVNEIAENTDYCVYICNGEDYWKMWEDYINYPVFSALYFIDGQKKLPITDEKLLKQERLLIYLDNTLNPDDILPYLQTYLPLQQYEIQYTTNYTYLILAQ